MSYKCRYINTFLKSCNKNVEQEGMTLSLSVEIDGQYLVVN